MSTSDALDLIDFANGPADSPWGKLRAQMGHRVLSSRNDRSGQRAMGTALSRTLQVFADAEGQHPEIRRWRRGARAGGS